MLDRERMSGWDRVAYASLWAVAVVEAVNGLDPKWLGALPAALAVGMRWLPVVLLSILGVMQIARRGVAGKLGQAGCPYSDGPFSPAPARPQSPSSHSMHAFNLRPLSAILSSYSGTARCSRAKSY